MLTIAILVGKIKALPCGFARELFSICGTQTGNIPAQKAVVNNASPDETSDSQCKVFADGWIEKLG